MHRRTERHTERTVGYANRSAAGHQLAERLDGYGERADVVVLGLPRGGVVTAATVADRLHAPLDVFCVRKLGVPWQPELAMGAVATGGVRVLNDDVVGQLRIPSEDIERVTRHELTELARREHAYRGDRQPLELAGRTVVLVDDGLATGATARAALTAVRELGPNHVTLAIPVAPPQAILELADAADELVCPLTPDPFDAVGRWYDDFRPTSDEEVRTLLGERP